MIPSVGPLISIFEAEARIDASLRGLGAESIALESAVGRVLAEAMVADRPLPPFSRAMMDGVALCVAHHQPGEPLKIAGLHAAGDPPPRRLEVGEAWEIMTGAMVPEDCNAVIPYEDLSEEMIPSELPSVGQFIHRVGQDAERGEVLVTAGSRIGPAEIAIAASVGMPRVQVRCRPRIAIVSTGDEAVAASETPELWQIRQSNGVMLHAALQRLGYAEVEQFHVVDDFGQAKQVIRQAMQACDVLILSGGISKGKKDHVRAILESELGPPAFHGVKLRPGKPMAFWAGPPHVFALPGNPVSVLATFTRFVVPALLKMQGVVANNRLRQQVVGVSPLAEFSWLLAVAVDGDGGLVPRPPRNSGDFASLAGSVGIVEIPPVSAKSSGSEYSYYPFP